MKLSYSILTHNEGESIETLLSLLVEFKDSEDEIIVVDDYSDDELTIQILKDYQRNKHIKLFQRALNKDFASQKNFLMSKCTGDYIFNIDADELIKPDLIVNLKGILELNSDIELYAVPRENTVDGLTDAHIKKWGWNINEYGFVNFPDYQYRIMRNQPDIRWTGKVHERPYSDSRKLSVGVIPDEFAIEHHKSILRQEQQNNFYNSI